MWYAGTESLFQMHTDGSLGYKLIRPKEMKDKLYIWQA